MCAPSKIIGFKLSEYKRLSRLPWASPRILCGTKEVKIISESSGFQNYPILCDNGVYYSLNGKSSSGQDLIIYYNRKSPIEGGRLVSDYTFAVRLGSFLDRIQVHDACSEDELEYLKDVAKDLLEWQIDTVKDPQEIDYLRRLGLKK